MSRAEPPRLWAVLPLWCFAPRAQADENTELAFHVGKITMKTVQGSASGERLRPELSPLDDDLVALGLGIDFLRPADKGSDTPDRERADVDVGRLILRARARAAGADRRSPAAVFHARRGNAFLSRQAGCDSNDGLHLGGHRDQRKADFDRLGGAGGHQDPGRRGLYLHGQFLAGGFLAWNSVGSTSYESTSQAKALGVDSIKGSMSAITFGIKLTARF